MLDGTTGATAGPNDPSSREPSAERGRGVAGGTVPVVPTSDPTWPSLEADRRIGHVVGFARRPFDPAEHGWSKMTYRRGDVRDPATLEQRSQAPTSSSTSPS